MAIVSRQVEKKKNADGVSTGTSGVVYDVNIRYKTADGYKTYGKRGYSTKQDALQHEAEMKVKLTNPGYQPMNAINSKQTVKEYMETWMEAHGKANLKAEHF